LPSFEESLTGFPGGGVRRGSSYVAQLYQLPSPKLPPEVLVGLPSDLLRRRPDIRVADRQLAAATVQVGGIFFRNSR
jgi:hypothetical protein